MYLIILFFVAVQHERGPRKLKSKKNNGGIKLCNNVSKINQISTKNIINKNGKNLRSSFECITNLEAISPFSKLSENEISNSSIFTYNTTFTNSLISSLMFSSTYLNGSMNKMDFSLAKNFPLFNKKNCASNEDNFKQENNLHFFNKALLLSRKSQQITKINNISRTAKQISIKSNFDQTSNEISHYKLNFEFNGIGLNYLYGLKQENMNQILNYNLILESEKIIKQIYPMVNILLYFKNFLT